MRRFLAVLTVLACLTGPARATEVGTALVLLVDVSGSVDRAEYELQRAGIAAAFRDPSVARAIWNQPFGRMAVTYVEWSDSAQVVIPWQVLETSEDAVAFAGLVEAATRTSNGSTALGAALAYATGLFEACGCRAERRVIDVSGDGTNNSGGFSAGLARDQAVAAGITVNGLPITGDGSDLGLYEHYQSEVRGGEGAFVLEADGFADFQRAIRQKLVREIAGQ
jgi:hypothetical protein